MKLLNIKLYGRRYKDTIHRAFNMWLIDHSVFFSFAQLSLSDSIGRHSLFVVLNRPHTLNIISENKETTEVKFHMKPSLDGGTKICIIGPDHITRMAAMPIYGKNHIFFFSRTTNPIALKLDM